MEECLEMYSSGSGYGRGHSTEILDLTVIDGLIAFIACQNLYSTDRASLFKSII
jgi:hypothetical protein